MSDSILKTEMETMKIDQITRVSICHATLIILKRFRKTLGEILRRSLSNEIIKTIESRSDYDMNDDDLKWFDLIKNLKLIKTKLQTEGWIESWNKDESSLIDLTVIRTMDSIMPFRRYCP